MDYTHKPLVTHADKVAFLYNFLKQKDCDMDCFLIIIGEGATGKSVALKDAITKLENDRVPYKLMLWNPQEKPYCLQNTDAVVTKWVMVRWKEDHLAMAFEEEWNYDSQYTCSVVQFLPDPDY